MANGILIGAASKRNGFSTILMVSIVMVASVALTLSGYVISNNMTDQVSGKKEFEMDRSIAKGLNQYLLRIAQEYYRYTVSPTLAELESITRTRLTERLALEVDASGRALYTMANFKIEQKASMDQSLVVNSVFKGMMAPQTLFSATYQIIKSSAFMGGGDIKVNVEQIFAISTVGMFKFQTFVGIGSYSSQGASYFEMKGRMHSNYDICVSNSPGTQPQYFDRLTAAGGVYLSSKCLGGSNKDENFFVSFVDKFAPPGAGNPVPLNKFKQVVSGATHGCKNCEGTGKDWAEYAMDSWKGHIQDSAHGVPVLTLPASHLAAVQPGQWFDGSGTETIVGSSNYPKPNCAAPDTCSPEGNIRMFVDPVRPSDSNEVRLTKFSYTADIRIIDGVWFVRDRSNTDNWPGIPIWSDHPGDFEQDGIKVGQAQIRAYLAGKPQQWVANRVPQRFSIYRFAQQAAGGWAISDSNQFGVISYGALKKVNSSTSAQPWEPAHYVQSSTEGKLLCNAKDATANELQTSCAGGTCGLVGAMSGGLKCQPTGGGTAFDMRASTQFLNAARSGYASPNLRYGVAPGPAGITMSGCAAPTEDNSRLEHSRMMPMNVNMRAFYEALADTTPGELGSYFDGGRNFNGQVYIAHRWANDNVANSLTEGFTMDPDFKTLIPVWASHGNFADATQIPPTGPEVQQSLPYPLCSASLAGQNFDTQGAFKIPNCDTYKPGSGTNYNYINMVRLYNGKQLDGIDPAKGRILGKGLSVVSSQALAMLGSWNADSAPANLEDNSAAYEPWIPTMVAGDRVGNYSNGWSDENARWTYLNQLAVRYCSSGTVYNPEWVPRRAEDTRYVVARLGSWMGHDEYWSGKKLEIVGTSAGAFYPVYHRVAFVGSDYNPKDIWVYTPPLRINEYDPHFDYIQPPAAPAFTVVSPVKEKIR